MVYQQGPPGMRGPTGKEGFRGPPGKQGLVGKRGSSGLAGEKVRVALWYIVQLTNKSICFHSIFKRERRV